ncbi:DNA-binding protein [Mycolicibacterium peregrinum]|uniref:helix-turn-helix transcriptional regulator n=1 Tax=Mycolicibacterium peregrinum TaxID=43304 RepID=UPI0007EA9EC7|nr:hypothetical protein [Mycolicibacterium peregrinum]OBF42831.1 DNA-binding protein [Mycolicibacterium peregrinum]
MTDTTAPTDNTRFISLREAGERVGLSYWSIRGRVRDGLLPAYRTGPNSALRVKVSDVDALLVPVVSQRD